jgi:hypothetical protein
MTQPGLLDADQQHEAFGFNLFFTDCASGSRMFRARGEVVR